MSSWSIARRASAWTPTFDAVDRSRHRVEVGDVIGWDFAAWEVTHLSPVLDPEPGGHDTRATLHRLYGPKHEHENRNQDVGVSFRASWSGMDIYRSGRVYLCSCCGHPAPCRQQVAEEASALAAQRFEERLNRMGPGLCYACGEVITKRQERVTFPGDHADFPGRSGPTFHTRGKCYSERAAYARRAGVDANGQPATESEATR